MSILRQYIREAYIDIRYCSYLKVKADNLKHFIDIYSYVDSNYRGTNGDSFAALSGKIESFSNVELERLHSYVIENGLSRDAAGFSNTIDYKNKLLKLDYDKNMAAYYVRLEAMSDMQSYEGSSHYVNPASANAANVNADKAADIYTGNAAAEPEAKVVNLDDNGQIFQLGSDYFSKFRNSRSKKKH